MNKLLKYLLYALGFFIVAIATVLTYLKTALPDVGEAGDIKIDYTEERIKRGEYLAHSVCVCMDCHSERDWGQFSGPLVAGTLGQGGMRFDQQLGFPGVYYSKNITPAGISRYTDGELYRVITTGVSKEGVAMFPLMPFLYYGKMDTEDIYSIIAYLRSIPSITNEVPKSVHDFPMNFIINTIPVKGTPQQRPDPSDVLAYGAYMTNASGCVECHTQVDKGMIIPDLAFGGGREFPINGGALVRSSNITPDKETGIGSWTKELFVARFKSYKDSTYVSDPVKPGEFNSWMPWTMYAGMKEEDLTAIFAYLQTVKPISNRVVKFSGPLK